MTDILKDLEDGSVNQSDELRIISAEKSRDDDYRDKTYENSDSSEPEKLKSAKEKTKDVLTKIYRFKHKISFFLMSFLRRQRDNRCANDEEPRSRYF